MAKPLYCLLSHTRFLKLYASSGVLQKVFFKPRASLLWEKAERAGTVEPGEEEAWGILAVSVNPWREGERGRSQALLSSAQGQGKRQWVQNGT